MLGPSKLGLVLTVAFALFALKAPASGGGLALVDEYADNGSNAFTTASAFTCVTGDTGLLSPSSNAADTGGDNDGFETNPTDAYADGGGYATNLNGAADRHRYYDYGVSVRSDCLVKGIELRLDWWVDSTFGTNSMSAELSWDGGTTWTAAYSNSVESVSEHTGILGGPTDTWGRSWSPAELNDAIFRVRVISNSSSSYRDFYLDWIPVTVYYGP